MLSEEGEMKEYGVGIVGFGFMGRMHSYGYMNMPLFYDPPPCRTRLVGLTEVNAETADRARAACGFEYTTDDVHQLIADDRIDIIDCCTPNVFHKDIVIAALEAGKHVYCDKPLATNADEADEIIRTMKEMGYEGITQMALQYRFLPATMRAKQLVEEGFLGRVMHFRSVYLHSSSINPDKPITWKLDRSQGGGGVLFDLGSHILDLMIHLLGKVESVGAVCETFFKERPLAGTDKRVKVETDDLALMTVRFQSGALGTIEASKVATGTNDELRFEIHGEKGAMRFNLMDPNWLEVYDVRDPGGELGGSRGFKKIECVNRFPAPGGKFPGGGFSVGWIRGHVACLHNFLAAVAGKGKTHPTFEEAAYLQHVMEAAYRAAETGTPQVIEDP